MRVPASGYLFLIKVVATQLQLRKLCLEGLETEVGCPGACYVKGMRKD